MFSRLSHLTNSSFMFDKWHGPLGIELNTFSLSLNFVTLRYGFFLMKNLRTYFSMPNIFINIFKYIVYNFKWNLEFLYFECGELTIYLKLFKVWSSTWCHELPKVVICLQILRPLVRLHSTPTHKNFPCTFFITWVRKWLDWKGQVIVFPWFRFKFEMLKIFQESSNLMKLHERFDEWVGIGWYILRV